MVLSDLRQYVTLLESCNELTRLTVVTDPILEIAAITDRICKQPGGGQALFFEQTKGSAFPIATNLFGSLHRSALALGLENLDQLTAKMAALLEQLSDRDIHRMDLHIAVLEDFSRFAPVTTPPAWNVIMEPPDLTLFPFLQSWPGDGAGSGNPRYITLPQVFTANPDGGIPNCGMYRAQVTGPRELAIRWKAGSGATRHLDEFRRRGKSMPVAIALGGAPAALFSAMLPLPGDLDEMFFAGFLRGEPMEMAACRSIPLRVPASAEVVIEGYVNPSETCLEGPFGNHTGSYSPTGDAALMRVTSLSHRPDAVIPATVVGPPPMEDCWMAKSWERILLAFLRRLIPDVTDIHFPLEWIFHQSAIISLEKPNPGMVREIAVRLWDFPWFAEARLLIFVDADDGIDQSQIAWHCINRAEFSHDTIQDSSGKRLALDATGHRLSRRPLHPDPAISLLVLQRWQEYGVSLK